MRGSIHSVEGELKTKFRETSVGLEMIKPKDLEGMDVGERK